MRHKTPRLAAPIYRFNPGCIRASLAQKPLVIIIAIDRGQNVNPSVKQRASCARRMRHIIIDIIAPRISSQQSLDEVTQHVCACKRARIYISSRVVPLYLVTMFDQTDTIRFSLFPFLPFSSSLSLSFLSFSLPAKITPVNFALQQDCSSCRYRLGCTLSRRRTVLFFPLFSITRARLNPLATGPSVVAAVVARRCRSRGTSRDARRHRRRRSSVVVVVIRPQSSHVHLSFASGGETAIVKLASQHNAGVAASGVA